MRTTSRRILWGTIAFLAVSVSGYVWAALFLPQIRGPVLLDMLARTRIGTYAHLIGGASAIVVGALQANGRIRARFPRVHERLGVVYVATVVPGGIAGFVLALRSFGGPITHVGFGSLAVLWLATTVRGYSFHFKRDYPAHGRWMIRSYALTLAAVTLRLYIPLAMVAGAAFEPTYQAVSWLAWVPNLLAAEMYLRRPPPAPAVA